QRPALLPGRRADDLGNRLREPAIGCRDTAVVTVVAHAGGDPRELWRVGAQVAGEVGHGHDVRRAGTPVIGEGIVFERVGIGAVETVTGEALHVRLPRDPGGAELLTQAGRRQRVIEVV